MGYSSGKKGYKLLNLHTGCMYVSRDVIFFESVFPFALKHRPSSALFPENVVNIDDHNVVFMNLILTHLMITMMKLLSMLIRPKIILLNKKIEFE